MNVCTIFLFIGLSGVCYGQTTSGEQKPILSGLVVDATGKPWPGVTVQLSQLPDTTVRAGTLTDEAGRYQFAHVVPGTYLLKLTAIGIEPLQSVPFILTDADLSRQLPIIRLEEDMKLLHEVTVVGQKKAMEVSEGKLVFNIEHKLATSGSSAFEILQRTPGISVTQDDNNLLSIPA